MVNVVLEDVVAAMRPGLANVVKSHAPMGRMKMDCFASATSLVTTALAATLSVLVMACAVRMAHAYVTTMTVMAGNSATSSHVLDGRLCARDVVNVCQQAQQAYVHADQVSAASPVRYLTVPAIQIVKDFITPPAVS